MSHIIATGTPERPLCFLKDNDGHAYLVPAVGTHDAVLAIVLGAVTGAGLLHVTYNSYFARLPVLLNIAQLIGWTTLVLTFSLARLSRARRAGATGWEQA